MRVISMAIPELFNIPRLILSDSEGYFWPVAHVNEVVHTNCDMQTIPPWGTGCASSQFKSQQAAGPPYHPTMATPPPVAPASALHTTASVAAPVPMNATSAVATAMALAGSTGTDLGDRREKKRSYTVEEKLAIVQAAKTESLRAVARRFNVDRNCIRAWREKEAQLAELHPNARRLPGAGRRPSSDAAVRGANGGKRKSADVANGEHEGDADGKADGALKKKKMEQDFLLVGFQGKEGAFSDVAARKAFDELKRTRAITPSDYETVGYSQVATVIDALERGEIEYGVLPIENSVSGTFHGILDRLISSELKIVGEIACVQELCLCAVEGAKIEEISCLLSHPAILDHCQAYITDLEKKYGMYIDRQATWDSAGACHMVRHENQKTVAAIASEQAAETHGLQVLEKGVGDELNNETRYAIVARREASALVASSSHSSTSVKMKSSIVIAVPNEPQALFKIVSAFALRNITIIKIESRPASTAGGLFSSQTHHWDYIFFVDYVVSSDAVVNERLIRNLEEFALWIKDLGTYASSAVKTNVEPPRWKTLCNVISC